METLARALDSTLDAGKSVQVAEDCVHPDQIQFAEDHFVPQNPFTAGARMLKVKFSLLPLQLCTGWSIRRIVFGLGRAMVGLVLVLRCSACKGMLFAGSPKT